MENSLGSNLEDKCMLYDFLSNVCGVSVEVHLVFYFYQVINPDVNIFLGKRLMTHGHLYTFESV